METKDATEKLAALGNESRLSVFSRLIEAGPTGLSAGDLCQALGVPAATASFHFSHLARTGLIISRRRGRQILYSANFPEMDALIAFLTHNCCLGESCLPRTAACDNIVKRRSSSPSHKEPS